MKKERREFISDLFRTYKADKRYLKFESTKRELDMSQEEKKYFEELKKRVDVVERVLLTLALEDANKRKFANEHLIEGKTLRCASFTCSTSESTLIRWKTKIYEVSDVCLKQFGL